MRRLSAILLFAAACACAQPQQNETGFWSDFRREGTDFHNDCFSKIFGCLTDIVHDKPLHLTGGSLAPQSGFGFGLQYVRENNLSERWTSNLSVEALGGTTGSWMSGVYFNLIRKPADPTDTKIITHRPVKNNLKVVEIPLEPQINLYAEGISLAKLTYYGLGPNTSRNSLAFYGMREVIVGGNVNYPLMRTGLSLYGEFNGRFVTIRGRHEDTGPSIEQVYSNLTAPGLAQQNSVIQPGVGLKFDRDLSGRFLFNYSAVFQEFASASSSQYSFRRLNLDFGHTIPIYSLKKDKAGTNIRNRDGSIGLRALVVTSYSGSGSVVPFYFQPTLGGGDINGDKLLPSYADYRFRAPNMMLFRGSIEHSIVKKWPVGAMFLTDFGRVALKPSDLAFEHLSHSYAAGLTIHAGGFPMVQLLFAWGGHEGTHTMATINPALLGTGSRPSLY